MRPLILLLACISLFAASGPAHADRGHDRAADSLRAHVVAVAVSQLGVREVGNNAGPQVEKYQKFGGGRKGDAWCSWFVTWCVRQAGVLTAKFGAARSWFDKKHVIWQQGRGATPQPGDLVGYQWSSGHINHVGIIEKWGTGVSCLTIEGNTGGGRALLREGQGVYRNWRDKRQVRAVADVISNPKY